jgi:hypothetical protein
MMESPQPWPELPILTLQTAFEAQNQVLAIEHARKSKTVAHR